MNLRHYVLFLRSETLLFSQVHVSPLGRNIRVWIVWTEQETLPGFLYRLLKMAVSLLRVLIDFAIHAVHCKHDVKLGSLINSYRIMAGQVFRGIGAWLREKEEVPMQEAVGLSLLRQ